MKTSKKLGYTEGSILMLSVYDNNDANKKTLIVMSEEDLAHLFFLNKNEYKSVDAMLNTLQDVLADKKTKKRPTINILDKDQNVVYNSDNASSFSIDFGDLQVPCLPE